MPGKLEKFGKVHGKRSEKDRMKDKDKDEDPETISPRQKRRKKGMTRRQHTARLCSTPPVGKTNNKTLQTMDCGITTDDCEPQFEVKREKKPCEGSMEKFAASITAKKIEGLKAEFKELQAFQPAEVSSTAFAINKDKNRYMNIVCYDKTKVVLTYGVPPNTDYIHANWVDSNTVKLTNKYICSQGPMDVCPTSSGTINDFWRMIWQERVKFIVMLCGIVENGKVKCAQYYPLNIDEVKTYGTIAVTYKKKTTAPNEKIFESLLFEVSALDESVVPLQVTLMRWIDWPDFSVPFSGMGILRILKTFRDCPGTTVVIHCSAGVGRTGTVMACEICLQTLLEGRELNVMDVVKEVRSQRASSIQTESQYIYLHRVLCEYIHAKKLARDDLAKFFTAYAEYKKTLEKTVQPTATSEPPTVGLQKK